MSENWDLYDKNRQPLGIKHLRGEKMPQNTYHIVVHVCIFNEKNQLLIQRRQPFKESWPGMWDLSAGGSALAGEASGAAAERETEEELGIKVPLQTKRAAFTVNFANGFDDFYIVTQAVDIRSLTLQTSEVAAAKWATEQEVKQLLADGKMIPYVLLKSLFTLHREQSFYYSEERK